MTDFTKNNPGAGADSRQTATDWWQDNGTPVYLLAEALQHDPGFIHDLEQSGYAVQCFSLFEDFEKACRQLRPAAVLVDTAFADQEVSALSVMEALQPMCDPLPVLVFLSADNDMQTRLAAHQAGAARFFSQPVDAKNLSRTLNCLLQSQAEQAFRVLIVSDDELLGEDCGHALENAAMVVRRLGDPLKIFEAIKTFAPDLVLLGAELRACDSLELLAIIQQDADLSHLPVILLATEDKPEQRLNALRSGAETLVCNPLDSEVLAAKARAGIERLRLVKRLDSACRHSMDESENLRKALNQHDIVSFADARGCISYANEKFCEISGYSKDELLGRNHNILNSGHHSEEFFRELWLTISSGQTWHGEICNRRKDGSHYWVLSSIVPFLGADGQPYQYVSLRTDITQLRENEERLERSQSFANIGTWDWNIKTGELYWSERIGPLFGYNDAVPETSYENFIAAVHPDDRQAVIDAVSACVEQGADYNIEHRIVCPDGSARWMLERGDVVRDDCGEPLRMLGVVQDITDRKTAETSLALAKEEAEDANLAKSQFLSSMSHELRTPMNAILGFAQLLEIEQLTDEQRESVNEISNAGYHLLNLINEVLDLAKIESGHINLVTEKVNLQDVFEECTTLVVPLFSKYEVSLDCMSSGCSSAVVIADHTRLKQALLNLLSNACKYNHRGGTVTLSCRKQDGRVRINVTDSGPGISSDRQEQLFQPFNRLGAEGSEIEGTGIGLVITRQLIELMGGRIGLDSEPGEGSTFWVELETEICNEHVCREDRNRLKTVGSQTQQRLNSSKVLYVEDNPANLRLVGRLLEHRPHIEMITAHEPYMGLDLAETEIPDLILLDINLPGIDGYEVLARLRAGLVPPTVPVIAISANAMPKDIERGLKAGFYAYLTKPLEVEAFLNAVDKALPADVGSGNPRC